MFKPRYGERKPVYRPPLALFALGAAVWVLIIGAVLVIIYVVM
jgi:hypothetical protein